MKKYRLSWISPLDTKCPMSHRTEVTTDRPMEALVDYACRMIDTAPYWFKGLTFDNIKKNIVEVKAHKDIRESYFIEFDNDEFLFCTEVI